jgi:hypothetical protein
MTKVWKTYFFNLVLCLVALFEVFFATLLLSEWVKLILIADQAVIDSYYFGSESMIGVGGFLYRDLNLYAWYNFVVGCISIVISVGIVIAVIKQKKRMYLWLLAVAVAQFILDQVFVRNIP